MSLHGGQTGSAFQNACSARLVDTEENVSCIHDVMTLKANIFTRHENKMNKTVKYDTINSEYFSVSSVAPGRDNEVEKGHSRQTNGPNINREKK